MRRPRYVPTIVPWLFGLFALLDVTMAIARPRLLDFAGTDIALVALSRAQVCLLAAWLIIGRERLSWRCSGALGGWCFIFVSLHYATLARMHEVGRSSIWLHDEWSRYFTPQHAGSYLLTFLPLVCVVAVPLLAWRLVMLWPSTRWSMGGGNGTWRKSLRFGLLDAAAWTTCVGLTVMVFAIAPYRDWTGELWGEWQARVARGWSMQHWTSAALCSVVACCGLAMLRHATGFPWGVMAGVSGMLVSLCIAIARCYGVVAHGGTFELSVLLVACVIILTSCMIVGVANRLIDQLAIDPVSR